MATDNLFNVYNPGPAFGIGSPWGWRTINKVREMHPGQDFPAIHGTAIPAAADGVVVWSDTLGGYGNCVVIKHTPLNGPVFYTLYAHLDKSSPLNVNDRISAGVTVGQVGISGRSYGYHLHFEVIPQQFDAKGNEISLLKGHTTRDPLSFIGWGDLPHMIGTDASGHAIVASTTNGLTTCKTVDTTGASIAGAASSNSDLPGITTPYNSSNPGTKYWVINDGLQTGRLYNNGVRYTKDQQTNQENWVVPTSSGGETQVTKFSTGLIATITYTSDGPIDTGVPGTLSVDDSASADIKAAFKAWQEKSGGDPSNVTAANIFLDQTRGDICLDARSANGNAVLIGETNVNGAGGDMIVSGAGNDLLIGSKGDDVLWGGGGNDVLAGGEGNDTYILDGGGQVTIEDKSGNNRVILDGNVLFEFITTDGSNYLSADGALKGIMQNGDFIVTDKATGDTVTLNKDFQEGDFGITFKDVPQDPQYASTITGDILPVDTDPTKAGIQAQGDAYGNPAGDAGPYEDILYGSGGNDHIMSGELTDLVVGNGGNDWIEGGNGNDFLIGDGLIEGDTGSDILYGGSGDDQFYGDKKTDTATAIDNGNTDSATGQRGDWLSAGAGADTLVTGADNDVLAGGGGNDLIIAGAGDDLIFGDGGYTATLLMPGGTPRYSIGDTDWYSVSPDTFTWQYSFTGNDLTFDTLVAGSPDAADPGNDVIYAGNGADHVWAGAGDDVVYGEAGEDIIAGGDGSDILFGGDGNDQMWGEVRFAANDGTCTRRIAA